MADPLSPLALGLGAASLTLEVFEGVKRAFEIFETALNMPEDCNSLKLRLHIEYGRLLDWGDLVGLTSVTDPQNPSSENDKVSSAGDEHSRRASENTEKAFDTNLKINRTIVIALLSEMRALLKRFAKLNIRYPQADELEKLQVQHEDAQKKLNSKEPVKDIDLGEFASIFTTAKLGTVDKEKQKYRRGLNHIMNLKKGAKALATNPKRFVWALNDKGKLESLLERLTQLTNYLHEMMGDQKAEILLETTQEMHLALLQLSKSVGDIKDFVSATTPNKLNDNNTRDPGSSQSYIDSLATDSDFGDQELVPRWRLRGAVLQNLAQLKATKIEGFQRSTDLDYTKLDLSKESNIDPPYDEEESRTMITFAERRAWVEWRSYRESLKSPIEVDDDTESVRRVKQLVALLHVEKPMEFRVPHCIGFFQQADHSLFGLVFEMPKGTPPNAEPKSLLQSLDQPAPSINDRISLAQKLAICILYLHAANWLHKGLRSESIIFFPSAEATADISRPYLSGFEYSRPDDEDITTAGPPQELQWAAYTHPQYLRHGRYRKTYDIYSLGIILTEIAHWSPIPEITALTKPAPDDYNKNGTLKRPFPNVRKVQLIRDRLLHDEPALLEQVRRNMGQRYCAAVRTCILGPEAFGFAENANQDDEAVGALLQHMYIGLVVDVLKSIVV
ncbi:MAG: hypothetical protein M1840_008712 [Geoglossum simile]|nr:MAG: hypothetical protein M1840_008712 [Geoglossum simile]